jgi:hypothetical protein
MTPPRSFTNLHRARRSAKCKIAFLRMKQRICCKENTAPSDVSSPCNCNRGFFSQQIFSIGAVARSPRQVSAPEDPDDRLRRVRHPSTILAANVCCRSDSVAKVFLGWRPKFFRTADAFRARRYKGPHRFTQKRPRSFVWALRSIAVAEPAKNQLLRDFRRRSIFDFCDTIRSRADVK